MSVDKASLEKLRIDRSGDQEPGGKKPLAIAIGVIALLLVVAIAVWAARPRALEVTAATAEAVATSGPATVLDASGYVTARRQATVSSEVTGKVVEVLIEEGMVVSEGQVVARLDPASVSASLRLAQAQVSAASSALRETQVRIDEAELDLRRARSLTQQQIASQADLDKAQAQLNALRARLAAQRDELQVAERQVALRRQDVDETVIRAPFAGVVISKNAQPGEMISPMSAGGGFTRTGICTIVDMDSLEIEVDVNEAYINRVQAGQRVVATLDAYPDWRIPAHVIAVIPAADRQKATVRVRIGFDEKDPRILPDMGVKVSFVSDEAPAAGSSAVTIPREAVRRDGEQDIVFVIESERAERRAIRVSGATGERARIISGLRAGEVVVVNGPAELSDGDRIEIVEASSS